MTACMGPELGLNGSNCIVSRSPNTANGPITYDVHGNPVQLGNSHWPYGGGCPLPANNGLVKDPLTGLWVQNPQLVTWQDYYTTPSGYTAVFATNDFVSYGNFFTLANTGCAPLQAVVSCTQKVSFILYDGQYVNCRAWVGITSTPSPMTVPMTGAAHLDDSATSGSVPFTLAATITRRAAIAPGASLSLGLFQYLYYTGLPGHASFNGHLTGWSNELVAWGWPSASPVSDM